MREERGSGERGRPTPSCPPRPLHASGAPDEKSLALEAFQTHARPSIDPLLWPTGLTVLRGSRAAMVRPAYLFCAPTASFFHPTNRLIRLTASLTRNTCCSVIPVHIGRVSTREAADSVTGRPP